MDRPAELCSALWSIAVLLENRVALITGAGSPRGIGFAAAEMLAEQGAKVALLDLDGDACAEAAARLGPDHKGIACDVRAKAACEAAAQAALDAWGRIDVLINSAGVVEPNRVMEIAPEDYEQIMAVNLLGTLLMCQAAIPAMRAQGGGSIVNISSVAARRGGGIFGGSHYAAAKSGVLGLTKALGRELAPEQIRVNAVCPGFIETDMVKGRIEGERRAAVLAGIPMGRAGTPREIAGACLYLASDLSSFTTGAILDVNGGSHIH